MLQTRTIESNTLELLKQLMLMPELRNCFLVGGTSLALQLGHRHSIDIDLFTHHPFESNSLVEILKNHFEVQPITIKDVILICVVNGIKLDCVYFRYPSAFPLLEIDRIRMADIRDIAPMKLDAITKRGSKKDFIDMYYIVQKYSLKEILTWYQNMFNHSTSFHVIRSLSYFEDAENEIMPIVFDKLLEWDMVKERMIEIVKDVL
jgi:hypothetical protein